MAETNTGERIPAKILLRDIAAKATRDAWDAKARGEKIGWSASNFPQELTTAMGIPVVFPENQGAAIAAKGGALKMCEHAEAMGYSMDLCSYSRINFSYADLKHCEELNIPQPDFLLCCNNICNCLMKWFENIALELNIPMFLIDIPHLDGFECGGDRIRYIRAQFDDCVRGLEALTGKVFDEERFREVMENSQRSSRAWLKATDYMKCKPSPLSGFDIFNHMAVACAARGSVAGAEAFEQLASEYAEAVRAGTSTFKAEEEYRILFEGIACWANLSYTFKTLKNLGINVTSTIYGPAFSFLYSNVDELMAAYSYVPNSYCFEKEVQLRVESAIENKVDGAIIHINRSCKNWSGKMYELERRLREEAGIPTVTFDGDQSDPRVFSEAQYETRVMALKEVIDENRKRKESGIHA
ncbi:MAG: 2-hydroxyacyl-CoA dehydratase family protein [Clostridiales Family XIII bacterium]|jgi:benzoyl-CoA reductase/2-hydroxyglutaryl-CoA dehydratase subunit BcrC/BadD/HgdB|nr:2-hydroxyacyl-CoA dehydratase family protein [Clostridiales Family XIII bacterium]